MSELWDLLKKMDAEAHGVAKKAVEGDPLLTIMFDELERLWKRVERFVEQPTEQNRKRVDMYLASYQEAWIEASTPVGVVEEEK